MLGARCTRKGRVVYNRKPRPFDMRAVMRILIKANNNRLGDYVSWQAAFKITRRNMEFYAEENRIQNNFEGSIDDLRKFYEAFDLVVDVLDKLLGKVPGAGEILSAAIWLYQFVRKAFPI